MATVAVHTKFLLDQYDLSTASNALKVTGMVPALDSTTFQATGTTFVPGVSGGLISQRGLYNGKGVGKLEQELKARLGTSTPVLVAASFGTNAMGNPTYVLADSWGSQLNIEAPATGLLSIDSEWPASGGLSRGLRIQDGTLTVTGTSASVDFGAAGTNGGKAFLFVTALSGSPAALTVDVESSATEAGTYASEGTFTLSAIGATEIALSGTVNRWLRINLTNLDGATSITMMTIVCISGVTY